jgi:hypothetical protein
MKNENFYNKIITRPELNFWLPIILSIVSVVVSFMALSAKVDLLSQKQDVIIAQLEKQGQSFETVRSIVMKDSQRITILETILSKK